MPDIKAPDLSGLKAPDLSGFKAPDLKDLKIPKPGGEQADKLLDKLFRFARFVRCVLGQGLKLKSSGGWRLSR